MLNSRCPYLRTLHRIRGRRPGRRMAVIVCSPARERAHRCTNSCRLSLLRSRRRNTAILLRTDRLRNIEQSNNNVTCTAVCLRHLGCDVPMASLWLIVESAVAWPVVISVLWWVDMFHIGKVTPNCSSGSLEAGRLIS